MKFPILTSFFILIVAISVFIKRGKKSYENDKKSYFDRERLANSTRRKSLSGLNYIQIPYETLPMDVSTDITEIAECIETISGFGDDPIVNLTGITNTDLKLEYGAPNLEILSIYDQRYTVLARTLQKWGEALFQNDRFCEAAAVLEFAVSTKTDISSTYRLLADIYPKIYDTNLAKEKTEALIDEVKNLSTPMKASVIEYLTTRCQ